MRKFESDCVGCSPPLRCLGITCPNIKKVERYYCDECGYEGTLYKYDGRELYINMTEGNSARTAQLKHSVRTSFPVMKLTERMRKDMKIYKVPTILTIIAVVASFGLLGPKSANVVFVISIVFWFWFAGRLAYLMEAARASEQWALRKRREQRRADAEAKAILQKRNRKQVMNFASKPLPNKVANVKAAPIVYSDNAFFNEL